MSTQEELREAEEALRSAEPTLGLQNQVPPDEEIQWVAKQDLRTAWFNLILHKLKVVVFMLVFGLVAAIVATGAMGSGLWGLLAFLLVGIAAPGAYIAYKYHYLNNTNIEYGGTDQQFVHYKETPSTTQSQSLPINRAKDASFSQDRWDKFLDTGNIHVQGIGRANSIYIKNVPNAEAVHRVIQQQIAETEQVDDIAAGRGGVQQQSVGR